jgi:hypothetical protein
MRGYEEDPRLLSDDRDANADKVERVGDNGPGTGLPVSRIGKIGVEEDGRFREEEDRVCVG